MSEKTQGQINVTSIASHTNIENHEVDLAALNSNPLSIGEVGTTLTNAQKDIVLHRLHFDVLNSFEKLPPQVTFIFEKIEEISIPESIEILKKAIKEHENDVNIIDDDLNLWKALVAYHGPEREDYDDIDATTVEQSSGITKKLGSVFHINKKQESTKEKSGQFVHTVKPVSSNDKSSDDETNDIHEHKIDYYKITDWSLQVRLEAVIIAYWSPYPQVRAVTDPFDDPTIPVETIRVYLISLVWVGLGAVINQFFSERFPSITLGMSVVQVFLYPSGKFLEWLLPKKKLKLWKFSIDLNPGPYNYKEQMLATITCGVSSGTSYVSTNILMQKLFYGNTWVDWGYQILLTLSTQYMGFALCGILRRFAVYPVKAMWPQFLPTLKLNKALLTPEKKQTINGWKISGYNLFFITSAISFVYFWVPNYLFAALSQFNWMTWIAPENKNLAIATGSFGGLGVNPIPSFDFNIIGTAGFYYPFYSTLINYIGMLVSLLVVVAVYFSNMYWTSYIPINSNYLYTNKGERYKVSAVVNEQSLFDQAKYDEYGPPFYSAGNLVNYGSFFAIYPFHFVYEVGTNFTTMYDGFKSLFEGLRNWKKSSYEGFDDPHSTMMRAYKEIPEWWYLAILVFSLVCAILCVKVYPAETPVWGIFFALAINFVFLIPLTSIAARTGFSFGLNVLVELIVGYAIPGNGLALAFIKALGYNIDGQANNFINDLKQGHYAKIPPRSMFRTQILSVLVTAFIQLGILNYQITGIKDYCDPLNKQKFICAGTTTFFNASVLWGVIGPKRVFDGLYPVLKYCFLIGFLAGLLCIAIKKYAPRKWTKYFEPAIFLAAFFSWAPGNLSYSTGGLYLGYAFMHHVRRKYEAWFGRYSYLLGSGIDSGISFAAIIMFFAVQYKEVDIDWWGNNVPFEGWDYALRVKGARYNATLHAPDGYFGPRIGHYP
ncbi:hypothetical protein KGF54_003625 [Candida jiufengensis]|uniref:uncharacterized protein n=1 Tax=Candida jiufengensis TaxID=497108 RepID=UPI002224CFF0|nr:uncharacterized protein KGF54_003625 [Candida jiufengensis]KAI5952758.1 hypothetical protein KGF54_003625 [Candida jiufengensis]